MSVSFIRLTLSSELRHIMSLICTAKRDMVLEGQPVWVTFVWFAQVRVRAADRSGALAPSTVVGAVEVQLCTMRLSLYASYIFAVFNWALAHLLSGYTHGYGLNGSSNG